MLLLSTVLLAQLQAIPRAGASCPLGYYRAGEYCVPSQPRYQSIPRVGPNCPLGTYRAGAYCTQWNR